MYIITAYKTNKRINSTSIPSGGEQFNVTLKTGCSLLSPVFVLNTSSFDYNMLSFNGRYYWVTDVNWTRENLAEVRASVDVLASWRDNILSTNAYVLYSSTSYNSMLADTRLLMAADGNISAWSGDNIAVFNETGSYTVGVIGKPNVPLPTGMTCVYSMTARQASDLAAAFSEAGALEQVTQQFGSAFNALIFCRWLPLSVDGTGTDNAIFLASYNTGDTAKLINARYVFNTFQVKIPWAYSDFRKVEPYSAGYLYLPYVGVIPLALSNLAAYDVFNVRLCVDRYTGDLVYKFGGEISPLAVYSGNCAVEVPINAYQRDWKGVVSGAASTLMSLVSGAASAGVAAMTGGTSEAVAGSGVSAATNALGGFAGTAMSYFTFNTGSVGGFSGGCGFGLGIAPQVVVVSHDTSQSPASISSTYGRPCGKTLKMSNLTGYVQTAEFKVSGPMTSVEKQEIANYMMGGAFIE